MTWKIPERENMIYHCPEVHLVGVGLRYGTPPALSGAQGLCSELNPLLCQHLIQTTLPQKLDTFTRKSNEVDIQDGSLI